MITMMLAESAEQVANSVPQWVGPAGGISALGILGFIMQHLLRVTIPELTKAYREESAANRATFESTLTMHRQETTIALSQQRQDLLAHLNSQKGA